MKAVYDTMVFLQAASRPDRLHTTMRAVKDRRVTLCMSAELVIEFRDVFNRENVRARFPSITPSAVEIVVNDVIEISTFFDPISSKFTWIRHPEDDHLFNLAIASEAKYLVTWETRILKLAKDTTSDAILLRQLAPNLSIITPVELAAKLRTPQNL